MFPVGDTPQVQDRGERKEVRKDGRPGRTRTCNHRIRNPMLYPLELRARDNFRTSYSRCANKMSFDWPDTENLLRPLHFATLFRARPFATDALAARCDSRLRRGIIIGKCGRRAEGLEIEIGRSMSAGPTRQSIEAPHPHMAVSSLLVAAGMLPRHEGS